MGKVNYDRFSSRCPTNSRLLKINALCLILSTALIASCGGGGGSDNKKTSSIRGVDESTYVSELQGSWVSDCEYEDGDYFNGKAIFSEGNFTQMFSYFTSASCSASSVMVEFAIEGNFATGEPNNDNIFELDVELLKVYATPKTADAAAGLSEDSFCGKQWKENVKQNISSCKGYSDMISTGFELVKVDGNRLYFGDSGLNDEYDGSSLSKRPVEIDYDDYLDRVEE